MGGLHTKPDSSWCPSPLQHQCQSEQRQVFLPTKVTIHLCWQDILSNTCVVFSFLNFFCMDNVVPNTRITKEPFKCLRTPGFWESNRKFVIGLKQAAVSNQTFKGDPDSATEEHKLNSGGEKMLDSWNRQLDFVLLFPIVKWDDIFHNCTVQTTS